MHFQFSSAELRCLEFLFRRTLSNHYQLSFTTYLVYLRIRTKSYHHRLPRAKKANEKRHQLYTIGVILVNGDFTLCRRKGQVYCTLVKLILIFFDSVNGIIIILLLYNLQDNQQTPLPFLGY